MCPNCHKSEKINKFGTYSLKTSPKKVQRYICLFCFKTFSDQTTSFDYRYRKRKINQPVFRLLSKGCSQRGCAQVLGIDPKTVARRVVRYGIFSAQKLEDEQKKAQGMGDIMVDEMESFEHTKLKPLTIPIAVSKNKRKILALDVAPIAAKGHLSERSKAKYGPRKCGRSQTLSTFFLQINSFTGQKSRILSDESPHYTTFIKKILIGVPHVQYKGGRGAIVGQGELKKKGFDPLFQLNHTYAMIRDNIKRLSRKTWCTTKKRENLKKMLFIYANYHNQIMDGISRPTIGYPTFKGIS